MTTLPECVKQGEVTRLIQATLLQEQEDIESEDVINTVPCWHQEQRGLCLIMRKLGQNVGLKLSRTHRTDPQARLKDDCETLVNEKVLRCVLDVPHAATDIEVVANLTKRTISCSMKLGAPKDKKRTSARVNWLTPQLIKTETDCMAEEAFRTGKAEETEAPQETLLNRVSSPSSKERVSIANSRD